VRAGWRSAGAPTVHDQQSVRLRHPAARNRNRGYPNDGNFNWSLAFVNGSNNTPAMRNYKDVYVRVSQRFNLERDPQARKDVQAAGPTGPRDHTSIRFGGFYYYGRNALNMDGTLFPGLPTVRDPFYRIGADFRFKYRQFELYGLAMYGHDKNLIPNALGTAFQSTTPITFTGGFGQAQYWIYPWMMALMRYDFVNSPTDFQQQTVATRFDTRNRFSPPSAPGARQHQNRVRVPTPLATAFAASTGATAFFRPNGAVAGIDYVF